MSEVSTSGAAHEEAPTLTLTDIANVVQVISLATQRGAWRPNELSSVGSLYDKLVVFLESAGVGVEPADASQ
jgi:hypothetical protein